MPVRKICIVTPDLIGPVRNGGIGTHCSHLAQELLSDSDNEITIFFTGPYETESREQTHERYAGPRLRYFDLQDLPKVNYQQFGGEWFVDNSLRLSSFLATQNFDLIHFQDWQANGFIPVQSKRAGLAFARTALAVTTQSPSRWIRDGMHLWADSPVHDALLDFCERYVVEHADAVLSPSRYMLDWMRSKGWRPARDARILPPCLRLSSSKFSRQPDYSHLAFFGRLETRKGLEIFCRAMEILVAGDKHGLRRITFLGKFGDLAGGSSQALVNSFVKQMRPRGIDVEVQDLLDSEAAQAFLLKEGAIAVMPSVLDNYPFAILECLERGIPFLASKVGGIPEMVSHDVLFEPTPAKLAEAVSERQARVPRLRSLYSGAEASESWRTLQIPGAALECAKDSPLVSVCIPYFNLPAVLPELLGSLTRSTYQNFEVIVVDDGSTSTDAIRVFHEMQTEHLGRGWRFLSKPNEGIGATRNFAASAARGELLLFMDADNLATPGMIADFVTAMQRSGVDCLTSHFHAFQGPAPTDNFTPIYSHLPVGPCTLAGLVGNVFGDANFCIRRTVFRALGGFGTERSTSYEDWEFLARLVLRGFTLDVVPKPLFLYRHSETGFSRATCVVDNHKRVLRAYSQNPSWDRQEVLESMLVPLAKQVQRYSEHARELSLAVEHYREELKKYEKVLQDTQAELNRFNTKPLRVLRRVLGN